MKALRELDIRSVIALLIVLAVVGRYVWDGTASLEEALKSAFMIAVGYYLGSSKGSADKTPPPPPAASGAASAQGSA